MGVGRSVNAFWRAAEFSVDAKKRDCGEPMVPQSHCTRTRSAIETHGRGGVCWGVVGGTEITCMGIGWAVNAFRCAADFPVDALISVCVVKPMVP